MPEVANMYLGNINYNSELAQLIASQTCLKVSLTESDRYKGRIHAHTDSGIAVGIIKSRDRPLESGDLWQTNCDQLILIQLQAAAMMVIDVVALESTVSAVQLIKLGHVLGNHHYPIAIQGSKIYVKLTTPRHVLEKLIIDLDISNLQITYETASYEQNSTFSSHHH